MVDSALRALMSHLAKEHHQAPKLIFVIAHSYQAVTQILQTVEVSGPRCLLPEMMTM